MSESIEWAEPKEMRRQSRQLRAFVDALAVRPGKWAVYRRFDKQSTASSCANQMKLRYGAEVTTRKEEGLFVLYARWPEPNGDGSEK